MNTNSYEKVLVYTITETNKTLNRWKIEKCNHLVITKQDIKSVFNSYFEKYIKHYLNLDNVQAAKLMTWHKSDIFINDQYQIVQVRFLDLNDKDHFCIHHLKKVLETIDYNSLQHTKEESLTLVEDISFNSIQSIKF